MKRGNEEEKVEEQKRVYGEVVLVVEITENVESLGENLASVLLLIRRAGGWQ